MPERKRSKKPALKAVPAEPEHGANRAAIERTLAVLGSSPMDDAQYQMLRTLADAVDTYPTRATLLKEYREALYELRRGADDANDGLEQALDELTKAAGEASMGNAAD